MKTLKLSIIIIISLSGISLHAQISDKLTIDLTDFRTEKSEKGYDNIGWKTDYTTREVGNPELPVYRVTYVLPVDAKVAAVNFTKKERKLLRQNIFINPVQEPIPTNYTQKRVNTQPNRKVYESDNPYPNKLYEIESDEIFQGYHIVTLLIYPFEYVPRSRTLFYYPELDYTIEYEIQPDLNEIKPLTQSLKRAEQCKKFVSSIVKNEEDMNRFGSNVQSIWDGSKRKAEQRNASSKPKTLQRVKSVSILDEIPPDYIIITDNSLKITFETLADWKTKKGIFTIIKTVEEIGLEYSGIDLQEKIRKYVVECYTRWGSGLYVLLGGDVNIVPARMVVGIGNLLQAADMYYGSYNGNWNQDGDNIFNAPNYMSQISIGIVFGRLPVKNATEASIIVNKVISYEKAANVSDANYLINNLYSDAYMIGESMTTTPLSYFKISDIKQYITNFVPSYIQNKYICDNAFCQGDTTRYPESPCPGAGHIELNRLNFLSCLNTGADLGVGNFHFIYHMDHAGTPSMGTSSIDKSEAITNVDMDNLINGGAIQILLSGSCHPANFTEDCIAEHYLNRQNGGGVAFIGNTDSGYVDEYDQLQQFLKGLFSKSLFNIGETYLYVVKESNSSRNSKPWRLHLLGDPEMPVWTNTPDTLQVAVTPQAVLLGEQIINVKIDSLPAGQKAFVCIRKGMEVYFTTTISDTSMHTFTINPETEGEIDVTVTAHNFIPYETTIGVNQTAAPNLFVKSVDFLDSASPANGNGNGKNDAGETIQLRTTIKNSGINTASNVTATLNINSPQITILNNQASIASLASGDTANIIFLYSIDKNTKEILSNDTLPIRFNITMMDANNTIWRDTFNIDVFADSIRQGNKPVVYISKGHSTIQAGDTVRFNIDLKNIGKAPTKGLKAKITSNSAYIQSYSSAWRNYPVITFNEVKQDTVPFEFIVASNYPTDSLQNLKFILTIQNDYTKEWNYNFDLSKPVKPTGLDFTADSTEIYPTWNYTAERSGFNIFRCNSDSLGNPVGSYVKINTDSITFRYYQDKNLQKLTRYLYKVSAISKSGNEGELSDPLLAWTSLAVKKYHYDFGAIRGGITTVDINNDGKKEIFAATRSGGDGAHLLGVDCNGQELYNIDGNVTSLGAFGKMNGVSHGTPAVSELAPNGTCQIYGTTRDYPPYQLYCFSNKDNDNDNDFKPDLLGIGNLPSGNITGAVLSNIDNSLDGSLEPVVVCENGHIAIYNSNLGLDYTIPQINTSYYSAISIADLESDETKEIIKASNNGIYIWNHDTTSYKGTNPFYTFPTTTSSPKSVVVCDIDNDGNKEVITTANNKVYAIRTDTTNTMVAGWNQPIVSTTGQISVGDLNHDGKLEIVTLGTNTITVLDNNGNILHTSTISNLSPAGTPILADIDGDSENEIIFGSTSGLNKNIYALNMDLTKVLGFPLKTDEIAYCVPSVSDIDGDGKNEIVLGVGAWIYIWKTNGIAGNVEWGCDRGNQYNTGEYQRKCNPLTITTNETWSIDHSLCGDIILQSGILKINNQSNLTMANTATVTIMSGATLEIDSGHILNANVKALAGSNLIIKNDGSILLRSNGEFETETGANVEILYGSIDKLGLLNNL